LKGGEIVAKIRKSGNVVVVSISPIVLKASGFELNDEVIVTVENGALVIRKVG
jgi:antitoxin component of MazEF toxin-antitoxin module